MAPLQRRVRNGMKLFFVSTFLLFITLAQAQEIRHIVAFGDSFTDNGLVNGHGFDRYSNGKVWVEYLSEWLGCESLNNRAWGGARTDNGHYTGLDWSGFHWQIEHFESSTDPAQTLYTVWIGINDYWDTEEGTLQPITNIEEGVQMLIGKGAERFLIFNNFDLTVAPGYGRDTEYNHLIPQVQKLVDEFNQRLLNLLENESTGLRNRFPKVRFHMVDVDAFMEKQLADQRYSNVTTPWRDSYTDPAGFLWYDEWHPMTSWHRDLAHWILNELQ